MLVISCYIMVLFLFFGTCLFCYSYLHLLKEKSIVVWLQANPADCVKRLDISSRPLLAQSHHPEETAKTIFEKRVQYYAETASLSIAYETLSPTKICNLIYEKINHEL